MTHILVLSEKILDFKGRMMPITIGKNGFCTPQEKHEGDLKTPVTPLKPLALYYRPDRVPRLETCLPTYPILENSGWCDAPLDVNYNQYVTLPYAASAENLYFDAQQYDYVIVTDYNHPKAIPHKGSAIFIHIMNKNKTPTEGCVAFKQSDLMFLIENLKPNDIIGFVDGLTNHADQ